MLNYTVVVVFVKWPSFEGYYKYLEVHFVFLSLTLAILNSLAHQPFEKLGEVPCETSLKNV